MRPLSETTTLSVTSKCSFSLYRKIVPVCPTEIEFECQMLEDPKLLCDPAAITFSTTSIDARLLSTSHWCHAMGKLAGATQLTGLSGFNSLCCSCLIAVVAQTGEDVEIVDSFLLLLEKLLYLGEYWH